MLKKLGIDVLLLFLILAATLLWLAFPQIKSQLFGNQNYRITHISVDEQVSFPESGFYQSENIRLNNPNLELLYSLDGGETYQTAPEEGLNPKEISNPEIIYKNTSIRWRHPAGDFPTLTSIVLKVRDHEKMTESEPKVVTYFEKGVCKMNVVNIAVNQGDIFDWERGIMIYGEESSHDSGFYKEWWYRSANFASRGSGWSRPAQVQVFTSFTGVSTNLELISEYDTELKISGNATRYFPQKSMKFKLIGENGKPKEETSFFLPTDGLKRFNKTSSLLLRQGGNDNNKTLFADLLMHRLAKKSNVLTLDGFPVTVFINGNYWGIYNFRERINSLFIAEREDVKEKDVTILYCEVYGDRTILRDGSKKEKAQFDSLITNLPEQITDVQAYEAVKDQISIKSFIDYIIFETFYANQDWLHNNTTWYKADKKDWKWVLNDLDLGLAYTGADNVNANLFDKLQTRNSITGILFSSLISYPEFNTKFKERAKEVIGVFFSDDAIENEYDQLKSNYEPEIDRQIRRWRFIDSREQWEKDCQKNVTFLRERRTIYLNQVDNL